MRIFMNGSKYRPLNKYPNAEEEKWWKRPAGDIYRIHENPSSVKYLSKKKNK